MKNTVTAGDYNGFWVQLNGSKVLLVKPTGILMGFCKLLLAICTIGISLFFTQSRKIPIDKTTVDSYEVIGEESSTSASSAVARGALGAALLGPIGIAAALSAKKKGVYTLAIQFKDGKKSLLEVDDAAYKMLVKVLF